MNLKYLVVIEKGEDGTYSAYVPDLAGCVSNADTVEDVTARVQEAIEMYIEDMVDDGEPVPEPTTQYAELAVAV